MADWAYSVLRSFIDFCRNEDGASAVEYGLIVAVISVALVGGASAISSNINALFQFIADTFASF
ncbi:Flp family type IVb pilin [Rhizobium pusense]|uniref:Flp family type IVb pilin n=1 Tax=Agrobacterium pusense TaxID=648995 RepID=A0AA44IZ24_9HYPH|nr:MULTISPECIES: Flp family type IVb pilin [Rhizobium/Agrobacterium group]KAJ32539.1 fimbriae associated protein [Agrobacterium tumefaciens]MBM7326216.1 Flp family type IVb pilin [Agrobacterium sp. S2]MCW8284006.1 Flp family type IVb pilin [Agrobacterium sp. InxBP2]MBN8932374.1 Flp family type IVb pilin [Agrobacterium pusense]MBW9058571.1 Flp family type IVb pilin [Agrobacterium pusense]